MRCPRNCATPLEPVTERGMELDRCPECHGLWLDLGEAEIVTRPDGIPQDVLDQIASLDALRPTDDRSAMLLCPRCEKVMGRERYSNSGVQIDRCGCGVWFDDREMQKLQAYRTIAIEEVRKAHGDAYPADDYERAMSRFYFDLGTPPR